MSEYNNNDIAMGWDDVIENDSGYVILPDGDYDFMIVDFERKRYEGSDKMSACPMASLSVKLYDKVHPEKGSTTITHNLFLNRKCERLLCAFFTAIGDRKHGEQLKMNWNAVKGKVGRCKVAIRTYMKKDGSQGEANEIKKFYEPLAAPTVKAPTFVPGQF